jgi:hypothetical protein
MLNQAKLSGLEGKGSQQEANIFQPVPEHQDMASISCTTHMHTAPGTLKWTCKQ